MKKKFFLFLFFREATTAQKLLLSNTRHLIQDIQKQKNSEGCQKYSFVEALQFLSKTENYFNLQQKNIISEKWFQREKEALFNGFFYF